MGLGFIERVRPGALQTLPQYVEHYFLVRRIEVGADLPASGAGLRVGPPMDWREAAALPLCLMSPEMYNRHILDGAFGQAGMRVRPVMETNSVLSLALAAVSGTVSCIMPGALVGAVRTYRELEARPLGNPTVQTPIGFMVQSPARNTQDRRSRPLEAALALAQDPEWLTHAAAHSGALQA
jgi:DNA-binding transcriptional LysR family regulator